MIRDIIDIEGYWKVIVYYNIDYDLFWFIGNDLIDAGCTSIDSIYHSIIYSTKAFTYSNIDKHISIVGFNRHYSYYDLINSITHEAEHVKQAMLQAYSVKDSNEPPAYTVGYLVEQMLGILHKYSY